jgi:hypothetical protein
MTAIEASQLGQPRDGRRAPLEAVCYLGDLDARVEEGEYATFDGPKLGLHDDSPRGASLHDGLLTVMAHVGTVRCNIARYVPS